jgi:excisionase family DNA binding protein
MEKLLLRVAEAAALVSISRSKGYELVASGQWPVVRIGRAVRVPVDELRAWVARQTREQAGRPPLLSSPPERGDPPAGRRAQSRPGTQHKPR